MRMKEPRISDYLKGEIRKCSSLAALKSLLKEYYGERPSPTTLVGFWCTVASELPSLSNKAVVRELARYKGAVSIAVERKDFGYEEARLFVGFAVECLRRHPSKGALCSHDREIILRVNRKVPLTEKDPMVAPLLEMALEEWHIARHYGWWEARQVLLEISDLSESILWEMLQGELSPSAAAGILGHKNASRRIWSAAGQLFARTFYPWSERVDSGAAWVLARNPLAMEDEAVRKYVHMSTKSMPILYRELLPFLKGSEFKEGFERLFWTNPSVALEVLFSLAPDKEQKISAEQMARLMSLPDPESRLKAQRSIVHLEDAPSTELQAV